MGDGTSELAIKLIVEQDGIGEMFEGMSNIIGAAEALSKYFENWSKDTQGIIHMNDKVIQRYGSMIRDAKLQQKLSDGSAESYNKISKSIENISKDLKSLNQINIAEASDEQKDQILKLTDEVDRLTKSIKNTADAVFSWEQVLKDLDLEGVYNSAKKFMTIGGQIGLWRGLIKEAANQMGEWRHQTSQAYGDLDDVAESVRIIQKEARVLQKEASAAAVAMRDVRIDPDNFEKSGIAIANFTAATGAAAHTTALYIKQLEIMGLSQDAIAHQLDMTEGFMAKLTFSAKDADQMLGILSKNMLLLESRMKDSDRSAKDTATALTGVAAMATNVGMEMSEVGRIMQGLIDDAFQYAVLLGDAIMIADPSQQFLTMAGNAGDALKMLEGVPGVLQESMAKSIYGMGMQQLKLMDKIDEGMKKHFGGMAEYQKKIDAANAGNKKAQEELAAVEDELRRAEDSGYAWSQALDSIKNALVPVAEIVAKAAAMISFFVSTLLLIPGASHVLAFFAVLLTAIIAFNYIKKQIELFRGFGEAVSKAGKVASTAGKSIGGSGLHKSLRQLGIGIRSFINQISKANIGKAAGAVVGLIIIAGAVIALGYAASYVDPNDLIALGVAMVGFGVAMVGFSKMATVAASAIGYIFVIAAALVVIAAAIWIVSAAFTQFANGIKILSDIDLIGFGLQFLAFSVPFAAAFSLIFGVIGKHSSAVAQLGIISAHFANAMNAIKIGSHHIADASWTKFVLGSKAISSGIRRILSAFSDNLSAIDILPKMTGIFHDLFNLTDNITGSTQMVKLATAMSNTLSAIAAGFNIYATQVEKSAQRISTAIVRVAASMWLLKLTGLDEMVRTSAAVTVRTELEDKKREAEQISNQSDMLKSIDSNISDLIAAVSGIEVGDVSGKLAEVKNLISTWLPEIANNDGKGLASATNQWNSGFG